MATVTLKQRAYEHILGKLSTGQWLPGQRLLQAELAREIGVSHIPVREAITRLTSEGVVVQVPRRGAFVRRPDRREIVELIELRAVLECNAAARAARRIDAAELDELETQFAALSDVAGRFMALPRGRDGGQALWSRWTLADLAFHLAILRAAGNSRVIQIIGEARVMTRMFGYRTDPPAAARDLRAYFEENLRLHRDVYTAVRRRDPKAARKAMALHMRKARQNLLARFDAQHGGDGEPVVTPEYPEVMRRTVRRIEEDQLRPAANRRSGKSSR
jgi:DNA-binding GntR family transcriptional regulator